MTPRDTIKITILPDARVKAETDTISAANHGSADSIIRDIEAMGHTERKAKHGHAHSHSHSHDHVHHEH